MQLDALYLTMIEKEKNSDEILNCGPITYTVNTRKIEYFLLGNPRAAYILTSLIWRYELYFDPNISHFSHGQYKRTNGKVRI
jgi:hypothetical protein